jgi:hypothetical protein
MARPKRSVIPSRPPPPANKEPRNILELDRFSEANLREWNAASQNLDELEDVLYFNLEPERRKLRPQLIEALQSVNPLEYPIENWFRVVDYQYSHEPLSCAGSLCNPEGGGRFNVGIELDPGTLAPWPALYIAQNYETAFRERFQMESTNDVDGLTPAELALNPQVNFTTLSLQGELYRVFDLRKNSSVEALAKILSKITMPTRARELAKKLGIPSAELFMVKTPEQVRGMALKNNWRTLPVQFGLPSQSHILAELIRAAAFEAILYKSTKGPGDCIAIFPSLMDNRSYIEVAGKVMPGIKHSKLDANTARELEGWEYTPRKFHP